MPPPFIRHFVLRKPEEYGREELNGKAAKFEVTLKGMKSKELPAIDDEFASD